MPSESIKSAAPASSTKNSATKQEELKGVGGWLYYLIGMLVFAIPALSVTAILGDLQDATNLQNKIPGFGVAVGVDAIMRLMLSAFAIFCGIYLWKTKPRAVLFTKIFFVIYIMYTIFGVLVVTALSDLPPDVEKALEMGTAKDMTRNIMFPIIWLGYLFRSKRVKATYTS